MILRPPRSTRTDTLCPYTTLFRSHVPVWFRQLPYSTLKDILLEYVTRSILVSCASRAARSLSSIDVPTIMPATGASPARFFLTQPIYLDNCPQDRKSTRLNSSH